MTNIILPNRNVTGDNLWAQVEDNDQAIIDVVEGQLTDDNIQANAGIHGSKIAPNTLNGDRLVAGSVPRSALAQIARSPIQGVQLVRKSFSTHLTGPQVIPWPTGWPTAQAYFTMLTVETQTHPEVRVNVYEQFTDYVWIVATGFGGAGPSNPAQFKVVAAGFQIW